jgi:N-acetylmuramic acid 6-phosphate etherase
MSRWADLLTEQRLPASAELDALAVPEMLRLINAEDARVAPAVAAALDDIAAAVELITARLTGGGRLFYVGAGTSGRLGVLDAAECPPTFNTTAEMVQGLIAGGREAAFQAVEGAEDRPEAGAADLAARGLVAADVVVGIAASGVTPYVHGALAHARAAGAGTVFFTCSPTARTQVETDVGIVVAVGPEVITGSTRMKAGTATKLVLNMLSTATMVRLGKTYGNLMVDLQPRNAKLRDRMVRILCGLTGLAPAPAQSLLTAADGQLKVALVMQLRGVDADAARRVLADHGGVVRRAVTAPE